MNTLNARFIFPPSISQKLNDKKSPVPTSGNGASNNRNFDEKGVSALASTRHRIGRKAAKSFVNSASCQEISLQKQVFGVSKHLHFLTKTLPARQLFFGFREIFALVGHLHSPRSRSLIASISAAVNTAAISGCS